MNVRIAVLEGPDPPFEASFENITPDLPYAERPYAELKVGADTTLADGLAQAAEQLSVAVEEPSHLDGFGSPSETPVIDLIGFVAFYKPEDEDGVKKGRWQSVEDLLIVEPDGRLRWLRKASEVTFGDLQRTAEAGVLPGDPLKPYLILHPPEGNGVAITILAIYGGIQILNELLALGPGIKENVELVKRLARRGKNAEHALSEHGTALQARGADPHGLRLVLEGKAWTSDELAQRLGCDADVAAKLLDGLGYDRDESGLWRKGDSEDGRLMGDLIEEIEIAHEVDITGYLETFRARSIRYLREGKRPPPPEDLQLPENWYEMSEGEQDAWSQEQQAELERELDELSAEDVDVGDFLPLEHLDLRCACGDADCEARMSFQPEGRNIRMNLENPKDHFVASRDFLAMLYEV